ncbi:MAG: AmmeMemoRadiSam system protein B, partial [Polyangiales bacterium]
AGGGLAPRGTPAAKAMLLPHGAWDDIGPVVVAGLRAASLHETVVVLSANHSAHGPRAVVQADGVVDTMVGEIPIDAPLAESLRALGGLTESPMSLATEQGFATLLPFLASAQPRLAVVPIALHGVTAVAAARVGVAIADAIVGRGGASTLVITTDLGHYGTQGDIASIGRAILEAFVALDTDALDAALGRAEQCQPTIEVCGAAPLLAGVHALRALGLTPRPALVPPMVTLLGPSADRRIGLGAAIIAG